MPNICANWALQGNPEWAHRFGKRQQDSIKIGWSIPYLLGKSTTISLQDQQKQLESALDLYVDLFQDSKIVLKREFAIWKQNWEKIEKEQRAKNSYICPK